MSGALLKALEEQAARLRVDVDAFLVGPKPTPEPAKPWSKKKAEVAPGKLTGEQMRKHCKPLAVVLPTFKELAARDEVA